MAGFPNSLSPECEYCFRFDGNSQKPGDGRRSKGESCGLGVACAALTDKLIEKYGDRPIQLEPLTKFPVIRDLMIDRSKMFDNLKRVRAWVQVDGSWTIGRGPRLPEKDQRIAYEISQVRMFNLHAIGRMQADERLEALTNKGGLQDCGNSQNCKQVCPKHINLTAHIAAMNRAANAYVLRSFLDK